MSKIYSVDYAEREDSLNSEYFRCCCNVHVRQAAKTIAVTLIVLSCLGQLSRVISGQISVADIVSTCLSILVCFLVIVGDREEKSTYYIPYLIVSLIGIIFCVVFELGLVFALIQPEKIYESYMGQKSEDPEEIKNFRVLAGIGLAVFVLIILLHVWMWYIVYRAYKYIQLLEKQRTFSMNNVYVK